MNENALYAYQFYLNKGYSPAAAAGIVGNLAVESDNFDPNVISGKRRGDKGTAFGVPQLREERYEGLKAYSNKLGIPHTSLDAQLGYVDYEMRTGRDAGAARAYQQLQSVQDPAQAAHAFMKHYERPSSDPAVNHIARRMQHANTFAAVPQNVAATAQQGIPGLAAQGVSNVAVPSNLMNPQFTALMNPALNPAGVASINPASMVTNPAAAAPDPMGGIFGLLLQARMAKPTAPPTKIDTTVPRPKMVDNRSEEEKLASVSQTPNVYLSSTERMRRRR